MQASQSARARRVGASSEKAITYRLDAILGISATKHTCNCFPRHTSDEAQPKHKARRVVLDSCDPDGDSFLTSGNPLFQSVALRLHVRDLRAKDTNFIADARSMRHSIQLLCAGNGSIPQALNQLFCFLKLLNNIQMLIQRCQSHVRLTFPSLFRLLPRADRGLLRAFWLARSTAIITPDAKHRRCSWTQIYFLDLAAAVRAAKPAGQFINPRHRNTPYLEN